MIAKFINRFVSHRCLLQERAVGLIHDIISSNHWLIREDSIDNDFICQLSKFLSTVI